ncbi:MAG: enoyl-CoA hydratase-related protein [Actinomycetota bacterium]
MIEFKAKTADEMALETVRYHKHDYKVTITLDRPEKYNSLNFQMLTEFVQALENASWDDEVAVVIVTGAGEKAFSTGADLSEWEDSLVARPNDYWKWFGAFEDMHNRLRNIGKPTIARLNGMVVGGGNEINIACDLAIAADDVTIRQIGNSRGSVAAGGATQWLPIVVGDRRAREMLWLNEPLTAAKALEWGLVNQVVPRAELDEAVDVMAQKLYQKLPECVRYTKVQTNFWRELSAALTVPHARDWLTIHTSSYETYEGTKAFREKRLPDYDEIRQRFARGEGAQLWGPETITCPQCATQGLPKRFKYCGACGAQFTEAFSPRGL